MRNRLPMRIYSICIPYKAKEKEQIHNPKEQMRSRLYRQIQLQEARSFRLPSEYILPVDSAKVLYNKPRARTARQKKKKIGILRYPISGVVAMFFHTFGNAIIALPDNLAVSTEW